MGTKAIRGRAKKTPHAHHVDAQTRMDIEQFLSRTQIVLRLQDWNIVVDWGNRCEKGALATMQDMPDSRHAIMRFSEQFFALPARERHQTILHELMHCHVFPLQRLSEDTVNSLASKQATTLFNIAHSSAVELLVDTMADVLLGLIKEEHCN